MIHNVRSSMRTPSVVVPFRLTNTILTLNFPERDFTIEDIGDGYSVGAVLDRHITPWISLGLEFDASFAHRQKVEEGELFYIQGSNISIVTYTIHHKATLFHLAPLIQIGRYFPVGGNFAIKPFVLAGLGGHFIAERIVLESLEASFELENRSRAEFSAMYGAGLDFRLTRAASLGVQYEMQRTMTGDQNWEIGRPSARFTYLF